MADPNRSDRTEIRRLGVREFRGNMAAFLKQARQGASFLIMSRDEVLAEIHPPSASLLPRRELGALRERIWMADDFDVLPPDLLAAMEGEDD